MPRELQVVFRRKKNFQVKLHLMLAWVPPSTDTGQRCPCHQFPNLCPHNLLANVDRFPWAGDPFMPSPPQTLPPKCHPHPLVSVWSRCVHPKTRQLPQRNKPSGGLRKEEKLLFSRGVCAAQDPGRNLHCPGSLLENQGARQSTLPTSGHLRELAPVSQC